MDKEDKVDKYIQEAIDVLGKADRESLTVPERRLYDAAMESYRYLPQAELLHDAEETARQIGFRCLMDHCGAGYVDFMASVGRVDPKSMQDVEKWRGAGWDAQLVEVERPHPAGHGKRLAYLVRVRRK